MGQWHCDLCGFTYEEKTGLPSEDIAPGTPWEQVPTDWTCPDCSAPKSDFTPVEA
jgi:rubredoxin